MPDDEVAVTPAVLLRHAAGMEAAASEVAQAKQAGNAVRVDNAAYGQLCTIVPIMINSLQDIMVDAIGAADASLDETARRLRTVADSYLETDRVSAEEIRRNETGR